MTQVLPLMLQSLGAGVKVAILDSGADPFSVHLQGKNFDGYVCERNRYGDLEVQEVEKGLNFDVNGHGTAVQSLFYSVAPEAHVSHFRLLDKQAHCDATLLCLTLDYVVSQKFQVINLSLGTRQEEAIPWLVSNMRRAYENKCTIVAACDLNTNYVYPGLFTYCISVEPCEASHPLELIYTPRSVVEFSAWGHQVKLLDHGNSQQAKPLTGASYACSFVSGMAARLLATDPSLDPILVKCKLREYAKEIKGKKDLVYQ
jgi:hypothetical protein